MVLWEFAGVKHDGERVASTGLSAHRNGQHRSVVPETSPDHGEVLEAVKVVTECNTSVAEKRRESTPMETSDGGHAQFGP